MAKGSPEASGRGSSPVPSSGILLSQPCTLAEGSNHMSRLVIYKVMHIDTSHAELSLGPIFILKMKAALQKVYFNFLS